MVFSLAAFFRFLRGLRAATSLSLKIPFMTNNLVLHIHFYHSMWMLFF